MRKNYLVAGIIISSFILVSATFLKSPQEGEQFKNLKVLPKDISEEKLDSTMRHFSISLGVRCNFCHAPYADTTQKHLDFASDKKEEKNTARKMLKMVAYLNTNFFNDEHSSRPDTIHAVVCYTCHRGTKEPDANVFLAIIDSTIQAKNKNRPH